MDFLKELLHRLRHVDELIDWLTTQYGGWSYAVLGLIVFCETGLVVTPFLPGDSLLFAAGAISMRPGSGLNPFVLGLVLFVCACTGDFVNYHVGKAIGPRVMKSETSRWLNKKHLEKTHAYFEKYGGKTIILARFVPIVRTFAPFVAGAGAMTYGRFALFNIVGAGLWVTTMIGCGVVFGQMDFVKKHFEAVVIGIVFLSVLPMVIEVLRARKRPEGPAAERATQKTAD